MKITNLHGLPQVLVDAVKNDPYHDGLPAGTDPARYTTVTRLVRPPQMNRLVQLHYDEIQEDASERLWALRGQATHHVIERAALGRPELLSETRLLREFAGWTIGGRLDLYDKQEQHLFDVKDTSVWAVLAGMKPEWQRQLDLLCWLLRHHGYSPQTVSIIWLARDWSRTKAKYTRSSDSYPGLPAGLLSVTPASDDETEAWLASTLLELEAEEPRGCTDEERWLRGGGWAVMKQGAKRARRLLETAEAAEAWIAAQPASEQPKLFLEGREAIYERCECYCAARAFCRQAQADGIQFPEPIRAAGGELAF